MTIDTTDLIKALKERKRQLSKWADKDRAKERIDEIDCILDTDVPHLVKEESEKSVPADLEEPVGRKLRNNSALTSQVVIAIPIINLEKAALNFGEEIGIPVSDNFMKIARHFYDLGCTRAAEMYDEIEYNRQRAEESVPNDLEEAAKEFAKTSFTRPFSDTPEEVITIIEPDKYAGFLAGAKWDRQQMMKEAVEGTVYGNGDYTWVAGDIPSQFKYGDKVRIIILKED